MLWINPADERMAWAYDFNALDKKPRKPDPPEYHYGPLNGLDLRKHGIYSPGFLDETKRIRAEIEEAERDRQQREAERKSGSPLLGDGRHSPRRRRRSEW